MSIIITDNAIDMAIHEIVAERGEDYVYDIPEGGDCVYADAQGNPSCLVGQVIAKLSPEGFERIADFERIQRTGGEFDTDFSTVAQLVDLGISYQMVEALTAAQRKQDQFEPWRVALEAFDTVKAG